MTQATLPLPSGRPNLQPRPYQEDALEALHAHVCNKETNPCVVIPTGGGKSVLMAWAIQRWKDDYPPLRVAILAHRKELVAQNSNELAEVWPGADIGIYAAGLKRRDTENSILYASIDSVYKRGGEFTSFDIIIVDEAHRIPPSGEGKYRTFIDMQRLQNPGVLIIGFTATPFRMTGPLCHKDHILQEVCYEAHIHSLIRDGFLCKLWSRRGEHQPDLSEVRRNNGGDYIVNSLSKAVDRDEIVSQAVHDSVQNIRLYDRRHMIFFCVDVEHCRKVSKELQLYGINAPYITASTPRKKRDAVARAFKEGRLHAICNVNVYTEGFNAKQVDCIVLLRPTLSKGLYVQMVGRGLRVHPDKEDCLILDYAHCIDEHGPVDCIDAGEVPLFDCRQCGNVFSRQIRVCPHCGWRIPPQEIEAAEAEERERRLHAIKASNRNILSGEPEDLTVEDVRVHRHVKSGMPDSLRVEYRCGLLMAREWICLDHPGFAGEKARRWWIKRFGSPAPTVDAAMENMFLANQLREITRSITVVQKGKYKEITAHDLAPVAKGKHVAS